MGNLFETEQINIDSRKRRHFYRILKKIQRISAVVLVWMVGMAILYGVYQVIFWGPYFKIDVVKVEGDLETLTKEQVIKTSGLTVGDHLLRLPVRDIQKRLLENPWIREAAVHRKFPNMVWIYVKEYIPEAVVRMDGLYYVDRFGVPFKKLSIEDKKNFPVITGIEKMVNEEDKDKLKSKVIELLKVKEIYENSQIAEIYGLSEIVCDDERGVSIITLNDPMELRLGFGAFADKLDMLQAVYPAIRSHGGVVAYVDLNSEGKVFVKYGT